ncbi:glutamate--tRNA ligase [bacterium]|nr:glutamate--tRNA ligase [bacterium]
MGSSNIRVRFAPSPTGPLHIGGVRTALYNYLFAKKNNGTFILRIEDTDQTRFVPGAEQYIIESLNWLGIPFDEGVETGGDYGPYRQSERKNMYAQYAYQLIDNGLAYYAFDTPEELDAMRERLKAANMPPKYDAASRMSMKNSLTLPEDEVKERLERGDDFVIRIKLPRNEEVRFEDIIRGWVVFNTSQLDDKVLLKGDGMPTYHLANIVDDHLMKISHVIRGEEWLPSAPLHVMLYKFFGWDMPQFAHLPLILKPDGNGKLSKRDGDRLGFPVFPIDWEDPKTGEKSSGYREAGYLSDAVVNMLAFLGWHPSDNQELFHLEELVEAFSLERVSKSGAKFDQDKAKWFNHQFILRADNQDLKTLLASRLEDKHLAKGEQYLMDVIQMMKEKVSFAQDILSAGDFFFEVPEEYDEKVRNKKWNAEAASGLQGFAAYIEESKPSSSDDFDAALNTYATENEINKGKLMQPLRWAVSGQAGGPPIFDMLALLGIEEVVNRINLVCEKFATSN